MQWLEYELKVWKKWFCKLEGIQLSWWTFMDHKILKCFHCILETENGSSSIFCLFSFSLFPSFIWSRLFKRWISINLYSAYDMCRRSQLHYPLDRIALTTYRPSRPWSLIYYSFTSDGSAGWSGRFGRSQAPCSTEGLYNYRLLSIELPGSWKLF